jgi:hypothetical protein
VAKELKKPFSSMKFLTMDCLDSFIGTMMTSQGSERQARKKASDVIGDNNEGEMTH